MGSAGKRAVIPQMPAWECLPRVQDFLGIFIFHLESFLKWKCSTCLGCLVAFAGQTGLSDFSSTDPRHSLCHMSQDSRLLCAWFGSAVPAHCSGLPCATAQLLGRAVWTPWTEHLHLMWAAHAGEVKHLPCMSDLLLVLRKKCTAGLSLMHGLFPLFTHIILCTG